MAGRWPNFETMAELASFSSDVPADVSQVDRRLHQQAYVYWLWLLKGRPLPAITDVEPQALAFAKRQSLWIELGTPEPMLRDIGTALRDDCGVATTAIPLVAVPAGSFMARLASGYTEVLARRAPFGDEGELSTLRGNPARFRAILLPFASNGHDIDVILGVINWKELFGLS